jgi:Nucleotidyl transferase AbiEii toxin, Type IV TA system
MPGSASRSSVTRFGSLPHDEFRACSGVESFAPYSAFTFGILHRPPATLDGKGLSLGCDDEGSFPMRLLHFRRTLLEKMFPIHSKVEIYKRDGTPLGTYARHYYDLGLLAEQPDVIAMLNSNEYAAIKSHYDAVSRAYFPNNCFWPKDMSVANSDATFPAAPLSAFLGPEYERAMRTALLRRHLPSWALAT